MYFYVFFYLHLFHKNTNNILQIFLPNGPSNSSPKRTKRFEVLYLVFFIKRQNFIQKPKTRYPIIKGKHPSSFLHKKQKHTQLTDKYTKEKTHPHITEKKTQTNKKRPIPILYIPKAAYSQVFRQTIVSEIFLRDREPLVSFQCCERPFNYYLWL